jgi:hypothetical protein
MPRRKPPAVDLGECAAEGAEEVALTFAGEGAQGDADFDAPDSAEAALMVDRLTSDDDDEECKFPADKQCDSSGDEGGAEADFGAAAADVDDDDDDDRLGPTAEDAQLTGRNLFVSQERVVRNVHVVREKNRRTRNVLNRNEYAAVIATLTGTISRTGDTNLTEAEVAALPVKKFGLAAAKEEVRQGICPIIVRRYVGFVEGGDACKGDRICEEFRVSEMLRPFARE